MKVSIYSIQDLKSSNFINYFVERNDASALRLFESSIKYGNNSLMKNYSEDFRLFKLGEVDDQTGKIDALDSPVFLVSGSEYKTEV